MKRYIAIAGIGVLGFLAGCKEEEHIKITGDIVGFVKLFDENGVELPDKSNVTVSLDQNTSATSDKAGRFEFRNMSPGTFKVEFKKEGFSPIKRFNFIFVGGNKPAVIQNVNLIALPQFELLSKNISTFGNSVSIYGTMTTVDQYYFRYYFSDKPDVSYDNYVTTTSFTFCCAQVSNFSHQVPFNLSASPVYMVAYAMSPNAQGFYDYYDYEKGYYVSPGGTKLFEPVKVK